jgi:DUF4097 and DUF4098 domain-containing protein YvlB
VSPLYKVTQSLECQQKNLNVVIKKLDSAKEYFISTNQGSVELQNVTLLFNSGCDVST